MTIQDTLRRLNRILKGALLAGALTALTLPCAHLAHAEAFNRVYRLTLDFNSTDLIPSPKHFGARMDMGPNAPEANWAQKFTASNATYILNRYSASCVLKPGKGGGHDDGTVDCQLVAQLSHVVDKPGSASYVRTFISTRALHIQLVQGNANVELPPPNKYFTGTADVRVISS